MAETTIAFHPAFWSVFDRDALTEIYRKCSMYTLDSKGKVELVLILSETLDIRLEVEEGELKIVDLVNEEMLLPTQLRAVIESLVPFNAPVIVLDE